VLSRFAGWQAQNGGSIPVTEYVNQRSVHVDSRAVMLSADTRRRE
jgi:hypothetical protein